MKKLTTLSSSKLNIKNNKFNPERFKIARQSLGFNQTELANHLLISRQSISKYENGQSTPSADNIAKMADISGFTMQYFYESNTPSVPGTTYFRSQSSTAQKERLRQVARIQELGDIVKELEKVLNFPDVDITSANVDSINDIDSSLIETEANKLRKYWKIPNGPIDDLINISEAHGIFVATTDLNLNKLDGASSLVDGHFVILLSDKGSSAVRRRNTMAHELGHIVLHGFIEDVFELSHSDYKLMEKQANKFAAALLMPEEAFLHDVMSLSMDTLVRLKRKWKVSLASMVMRLSDLSYISEDQGLYLNKKISKNHWRKSEPLDDKLIPEKPQLFKKALLMIEDAKIYDRSSFAQKLGIPLDFLSEIFDLNFESKKSSANNAPTLKLFK